MVGLADDPKPLREALAKGSGMTVKKVADCPIFLTGPSSEIRDRLEKRREETGISYVVISERALSDLAPFAEQVVKPLAGR
jgi:hypothetical protein